jgi:DNA polymerase-3 subunit beta
MSQVDTAVASALKLTCAREDLAHKAGVVARAISQRTSVQVLAGVLLEAGDGQLALAATDMDLSLRASLAADVELAGRAVVPGRLVVDVTRLLPDANVAIEYRPEEAAVSITCGPAEYRLRTYSAEDFPRLPEVGDDVVSEIPGGSFLHTVARVSRAASRDESRPVLTGILVRFDNGKLVMAATDSYRLAVKETPLEGGVPALEAIVPARALGELARVAQGSTTMRLGMQENHVVFGTDEAWLTTRRIDGQFPDYRQLVPESFEHEVTFTRAELLDVVRRVSVMAQRNSPLRLRFEHGQVTISAQTQDVGEARETLPVPFAGEPLEMGFNADFLREGIESVETDEVTLKLISPLRPGLIHAAEEGFWYLIMPIRLAG